MTPTASEVTRYLLAWREGDREALGKLMPLVYDELRRIAAGHLRREREGHTLQPTALVNLAAFAPRQSRVVELRYFAGLDVKETAAASALPRGCGSSSPCARRSSTRTNASSSTATSSPLTSSSPPQAK